MKKFAVVVATAMLAGGLWTGAPTASAVEPALARGAEGTIQDIPWSQVGGGWMLAMWSPATPTRGGAEPATGQPTFQTSATTLYLISPEGGRYAITTFPPPGDDGSTPSLVDW